MPYVGQTITEVFPTSISVDSAAIEWCFYCSIYLIS